MTTQTPLLPTLYALLPPSQHTLQLSRLSLQAIHTEKIEIRDAVYLATHPVVPGQSRMLRLRAIRSGFQLRVRRQGRRSSDSGTKGVKRKTLYTGGEDGNRNGNQKGNGWSYSLTYLSNPLSGREYSEMRVQACISVDLVGMTRRKQVEGYVRALGFKHSHTICQKGHLFHLPIPLAQSPMTPPLTLHLIISRISSHSPSSSFSSSKSAQSQHQRQIQPPSPIVNTANSSSKLVVHPNNVNPSSESVPSRKSEPFNHALPQATTTKAHPHPTIDLGLRDPTSKTDAEGGDIEMADNHYDDDEGDDDDDGDNAADGEPYFITLQPSRPVFAAGDLALNEVMVFMSQMVDSRLDGIDWGTGK